MNNQPHTPSPAQAAISSVQAALNRQLDLAKRQLAMSEGCITRYNRVVAWPTTLMTVSRDPETGKPFASSDVIATQWTEGAAAILTGSITNGRGESPIALPVQNYYRRRIEKLEQVLNELYK